MKSEQDKANPPPFSTIGSASLYLGDCRQIIRALHPASVDSIVTDPPYELGFMGKGWDKTGIANDPAIWRECLRVLKPGGYLLAFSGSRTYHRMTCAIEDAGFEIRDQIMWIYGSGFPKSHNLEPFSLIDSRQTFDEWGTALKPAHEPICMARKPLIGTIAENVLQYSTGGLNIGNCRIPTSDDLREGSGGLLSHVRDSKPYPNQSRAGEASCENRYTENGGTNFAMKPGVRGGDPDGRWPANIIHDGSDEVVSAFPAAPGQQAAITGNEPTSNGFSGLVKYGGNKNRIAFPEPRKETDKNASRFFYCAKASKADREEGLEHFPRKQQDESRKDGNPGGDNPRNRGLSLRANHHPTVKPTALMRYLCRLVTPPNGLILDHFMGSGSTGKAAALEGFRFVGIDCEQEYIDISAARIAYASKQPVVTSSVTTQAPSLIVSNLIPLDNNQLSLL